MYMSVYVHNVQHTVIHWIHFLKDSGQHLSLKHHILTSIATVGVSFKSTSQLMPQKGPKPRFQFLPLQHCKHMSLSLPQKLNKPISVSFTTTHHRIMSLHLPLNTLCQGPYQFVSEKAKVPTYVTETTWNISFFFLKNNLLGVTFFEKQFSHMHE